MNTPVPRTIRMQSSDNVAIVVNDDGLPAGTVFPDGLVLLEAVPQGHKVSLVDLADGAPVIRYGVVIGYANGAIPRGCWVSERVLRMPAARSLEDLPVGTHAVAAVHDLDGYTFEGYRNKDGSVGTRNIMAITSTVQCVSGVIDYAVKRIKEELLPRYPNVEDVVSLEHVYGCGVAIDAPGAEIPIKTIRNLSRNPNFGDSVMVVSLGCEKLPPARLFPAGAIPIGNAEPSVVTLQDQQHVGFMSMIDSLMRTAEQHLQELNARTRETCPASDLVVGVQCGGSDAFSGVTANPAVGFATDLLVRAGATVMFSEVTEVRDG
ncbi:MAG: UxaA family hydrolase, partial [Telluria sp.]